MCIRDSYIVPEVEDDTVIQLSGNKLVDEYTEARALGIETKSVVIGAYTMLRLCRFTGKKTALDYVCLLYTSPDQADL